MTHQTSRYVALALVFLASLVNAPSLRAQTPQELQSELQQMKTVYEKEIAALEARIAALEKQNVAIAAAMISNSVIAIVNFALHKTSSIEPSPISIPSQMVV